MMSGEWDARSKVAKAIIKQEALKEQGLNLYNIAKPLTGFNSPVGSDRISDRELEFWAEAEKACKGKSYNDMKTIFNFAQHRYSGSYW